MVGYSAEVVRQRAKGDYRIRNIGLLAIAGSTTVSLLVVFGLGVLDFTPVSLIVTAGITVGNTMPATVLAVTRTNEYLVTGRGELEGMLALGFGRTQVAKVVGAIVTRSALIPQLERTKVVGLIALPGAMTGLLLAGVDPIQAVLIQLVVMYLILGSVTLSVLLVTMASARNLLTTDLRVRERVF
jgi:putative ABC transport system permease protein